MDKSTTLTKHLFDHLPTGVAVHRMHPKYSAKCPSFPHAHEDCHHIMSCPSPLCKAWRQKLFNSLRFIFSQSPLYSDPVLLDILEDGIQGWFQSSTFHVPLQPYPQKYHRTIRSQNRLGWLQVFKARMTKYWATSQQDYLERQGLSAP